jgi:F0F1-type ATP synthase assembly protein I
MIARQSTHNSQFHMFTGVVTLSAWSFVEVIASLFFLWVGYRIDEFLGTPPVFMLGLFLLSFIACWTKLYAEARNIMKDV